MFSLSSSRRSIGAAALLYTLTIAGLPAQSTRELQPPPLGKLIDVGGYRVHLYCTGRGSPTVVITGAGASFDWGLVQPALATEVRVCAYDHSGSAWSDAGPRDACSVRVHELHAALKNAAETGPFILVGHSLGALVARLYAAEYADQVAGVVIVDHATAFPARNISLPPQRAVPSGFAPIGTRVPIGEEAFQKLPAREYALHRWANTLPNAMDTRRNNPSLLPECIADIDARTGTASHPLGSRPLVVLHTNSGDRPGEPSQYMTLQATLARLSTNSITIQADQSSHYIMLDRPDLVQDAIRRVLASVRRHSRLQ